RSSAAEALRSEPAPELRSVTEMQIFSDSLRPRLPLPGAAAGSVFLVSRPVQAWWGTFEEHAQNGPRRQTGERQFLPGTVPPEAALCAPNVLSRVAADTRTTTA